jgi:hypothetical protein
MSLLLVTWWWRVPTPGERALWESALAQDSGDGLRAYLRAYPNGAHADEAKSRLAGCQIEETLGPEKDVRFVLRVNARRPSPTEEEARRDALARGDRDAATTCKPQNITNVLRAASAEPHDWQCDGSADGFTCGFDGEIVCRVQNRVRVERCRQPRGSAHPEPASR